MADSYLFLLVNTIASISKLIRRRVKPSCIYETDTLAIQLSSQKWPKI